MEFTRVYAVDVLRKMKVGERLEMGKAVIESSQMSKSAMYLKGKGEGVWRVLTAGRKRCSTYFVERVE